MPFRHAALQQLALKVLTQRAGASRGSEALAAAARRAHDDLARVASPLIGRVGVDALTARAVHLAQQKCSWLAGAREPEHAHEPFTQVLAKLTRQDPAIAADGAALVFAMLAGLFVTFIGEPLTESLMRKAWPEAFSDARNEER